MKLSRRMHKRIAFDSPVSDDIIEDWANDVAKLEADRDDYRNQYHMAEAKVLSRDALLEQLSEEQLTQDLVKAEAENEALLSYKKEVADMSELMFQFTMQRVEARDAPLTEEETP